MVEPRFTLRQSGSIINCILPVEPINKNKGSSRAYTEIYRLMKTMFNYLKNVSFKLALYSKSSISFNITPRF